MALRLNSDKVMCKVLEDDFRLPEEESSKEENDGIQQTIHNEEVATLSSIMTSTDHCSVPMKERAFSERLKVHMQPQLIACT